MSREHFDWQQAREMYEDGAPVVTIAAALGTTRKSVHLHIRSEGWQRPQKPESETMVAGDVHMPDLSQMEAPTVTLNSDAVADWSDLHGLYREAVALADHGDFEQAAVVARLLRDLAGTLHVIEAGEEKAGVLVSVEDIGDERLDQEITELQRRIERARGDSTLH